MLMIRPEVGPDQALALSPNLGRPDPRVRRFGRRDLPPGSARNPDLPFPGQCAIDVDQD